MVELHVNLDAVTELRRIRKTGEPEPATAALVAEMAGAAGISVHLRQQGRHTEERDVRIWKEVLRIPVTLVINAHDEMLKVALALAPRRVILISERHEENAPGTGIDLLLHMTHVQRAQRLLREAHIGTLLFMEPDLDQIKAASKASVDGVVLNSLRLAESLGTAREQTERERLGEAARVCHKYGLRTGAFRGISYRLAPILRSLEIDEAHAGHALASRAIFTGYERAVAEMASLLR